MLPKWLRSSYKVNWNSPKEGVDLNLVILRDSSDWEDIFTVPLISKGRVGLRANITVKMKVGVILPEPQEPRDPMSYMISDGDSIGMQLLDPNHDYSTKGPSLQTSGG